MCAGCHELKLAIRHYLACERDMDSGEDVRLGSKMLALIEAKAVLRGIASEQDSEVPTCSSPR